MTDPASSRSTDASSSAMFITRKVELPAGEPFSTIEEFRQSHLNLLKSQKARGEQTDAGEAIKQFLARGHATGTRLDRDADREAAQSLLDYWVTVLYRAAREEVLTVLAEFDPSSQRRELAPEQCPYPGLESFSEKNAHLYFGREASARACLRQLEENPNHLLAVVGPSGSGRTSLVHGGIIPALKQGAVSSRWHYFPAIVPGRKPLEALAELTREQPGAPLDSAFIERFRKDPHQLRKRIQALTHGVPGVMVIERFAELFSHDDAADRRAFAANLQQLVSAPGGLHRVILVLRSTAETHLAELKHLGKLIEYGRYLMPPADATLLRAAIVEPARVVALRFE